MIKLGCMQALIVAGKLAEGSLLAPKNNPEETVLLPNSQAPQGLEESDEIEVFVYKDSEDRLTATTQRPKLTLDEIASLTVKEVTKIGAFLDWGLPKDLLLPYREQRIRVREGREYLVGLYIDKSGRLCATMEIYDFLRTDSPYIIDDWVTGIVYDVENDLGALVAVDSKYNALIPKTELIGKYKPGDEVEARVARVREDGKLDLSLRDRPGRQMEKDAGLILTRLQEGGGTLALNDKSSPQEIRARLNMSKGSYKRAVGRLLKEGQIQFTENGIKLRR